jgi:hypothetical protein
MRQKIGLPRMKCTILQVCPNCLEECTVVGGVVTKPVFKSEQGTALRTYSIVQLQAFRACKVDGANRHAYDCRKYSNYNSRLSAVYLAAFSYRGD